MKLFLSLVLVAFGLHASTAFSAPLTDSEVEQLKKELIATVLDGKSDRQIGECTVFYDSGNFKVIDPKIAWIRLAYSMTDTDSIFEKIVDHSNGTLTLISRFGESRNYVVLTAKPPSSAVFTQIVARSEKLSYENVGTATNPKIVQRWKPDLVLDCN